jgi:hypothetical protein
METMIILGATRAERAVYIDDLLSRLEIGTHDRWILQKDDEKIGIGDIHTFVGNICLVPQFSALSAAIIFNAQRLTPEAQNALLKTLEEPPPHLRIILEADTGDALLPTILSRTSLIRLKTEARQQHEIAEDVRLLVSGKTPAEHLRNSEILLKKYPQPMHFLDSATDVLHQILLDSVQQGNRPDPLSPYAANLLGRMMACRRYLKASVTPIAVMDYLIGLK